LKKITILIIIGILLVGTIITAKIVMDEDFDKKVKKIKTNKLCEKRPEKCDENTPEEIDVENSSLSFMENKDGVIRITNE